MLKSLRTRVSQSEMPDISNRISWSFLNIAIKLVAFNKEYITEDFLGNILKNKLIVMILKVY